MKNLPRTQTIADRAYDYDAAARLLTIVTSGVMQAYEMLPLDDGGYRLVKEGGGDAYDVLIGENPRLDLCTCPAGRHGRHCKHVAAVRDLTVPKEMP